MNTKKEETKGRRGRPLGSKNKNKKGKSFLIVFQHEGEVDLFNSFCELSKECVPVIPISTMIKKLMLDYVLANKKFK